MKIAASFLFFFATLMATQTSEAKAAPYISYPDFVLMSQQNRYKVVHMVQNYVVELEQQGKYHALTQKNKYTFVDFLIQSAYANGITQGHGTPCMYAGWPSVMERVGNSTYCNNPGKYNKSIPRYSQNSEREQSYMTSLEASKATYNSVKGSDTVPVTFEVKDGERLEIKLDSNKRCNPSNGDVICNPLVFGRLDAKPFCVIESPTNHGYNASYLCERAVNKVKTDDTLKEKYPALMDGIIAEALKSEGNRTFFLNTLQDMYDMCMCSQDQDENGNYKNGRINKGYADRMFYTRTCAGILYETQTLLNYAYENQEKACPLFKPVGEDNKDWVSFVQQAHKNIKIETENLSRDFVRYLEVDHKEARAEENRVITEKRNTARSQRPKNVFCPLEMEMPPEELEQPVVACELTVKENEDKTELEITFVPDEGKAATEYKFEPAIEFTAGDDGKLTGIYKIPGNEESADTPTTEEPKSAEVAQIEFKALHGEDVACHAIWPESTPEEPTPAEQPQKKDCSLALSKEASEDGYNIIAKVVADGKEIKRGTEGYTVSFTNTSLDPEEEEEKDGNEGLLAADPEMVGDAPESDDDAEETQEQVTGRAIASKEEGDKFMAFVETLDEEQKIIAKLIGPEGSECSASEEISIDKKPAALQQGGMGGPALKKPNLMQMRQRRGGTFRRGNH